MGAPIAMEPGSRLLLSVNCGLAYTADAMRKNMRPAANVVGIRIAGLLAAGRHEKRSGSNYALYFKGPYVTSAGPPQAPMSLRDPLGSLKWKSGMPTLTAGEPG